MSVATTLSEPILAYETRLARDFDWALREGCMHFEGESAVHKTLRGITQRLEDLGIEYCVVGGMAMFAHGYRRFTEDVALLVTAESLRIIHDELEGRGYRPPFAGSKQLRDTDTGVRVEFLVTGQYPGDGKPKPIAFPDPADASVTIDGLQVVRLEKLVELKLASGLTNPGRLKDLGDVQELIRTLHLPADFVQQLHPMVQSKFSELFQALRSDSVEP